MKERTRCNPPDYIDNDKRPCVRVSTPGGVYCETHGQYYMSQWLWNLIMKERRDKRRHAAWLESHPPAVED